MTEHGWRLLPPSLNIRVVGPTPVTPETLFLTRVRGYGWVVRTRWSAAYQSVSGCGERMDGQSRGSTFVCSPTYLHAWLVAAWLVLVVVCCCSLFPGRLPFRYYKVEDVCGLHYSIVQVRRQYNSSIAVILPS
jgi:hypothetical protein